jgi:dihydropteroate synthase
VDEFFADRLARLEALGVRREQVALDPGIGFGKTLEHNLQLLAALPRFSRHGRPVLLGVSRKSFLGKLTGADNPPTACPARWPVPRWPCATAC